MSDQHRVLITGAAGDIGRAIALELASAGWAVMLHDHPSRSDALHGLEEDCRAQGGAGSIHLFDIAGPDLRAEIERCVSTAGVPDALINAAGVQGSFTA